MWGPSGWVCLQVCRKNWPHGDTSCLYLAAMGLNFIFGRGFAETLVHKVRWGCFERNAPKCWGLAAMPRAIRSRRSHANTDTNMDPNKYRLFRGYWFTKGCLSVSVCVLSRVGGEIESELPAGGHKGLNHRVLFRKTRYFSTVLWIWASSQKLAHPKEQSGQE